MGAAVSKRFGFVKFDADKTPLSYFQNKSPLLDIDHYCGVSVKYLGLNLELLEKLKRMCDVMPSSVVTVCAEYTRNTVQSKTPFAPTLTSGVNNG